MAKASNPKSDPSGDLKAIKSRQHTPEPETEVEVVKRGRGRPASTGETGQNGEGSGKKKSAEGVVKKKYKRRASVAQKMRKQREITRARRSLQSDKASSGNEGPKPQKVFNDELNNTGLEYEAEKIVASKLKGGKRFYYVKWAGYTDSESTWEPEVNLRNAHALIAEFDEANPSKP